MVEGSCERSAGLSPRSCQLNDPDTGSRLAGGPPLQGKGHSLFEIDVPDERAQARNLGGTAKQPFALNEGGRLFL